MWGLRRLQSSLQLRFSHETKVRSMLPSINNYHDLSIILELEGCMCYSPSLKHCSITTTFSFKFSPLYGFGRLARSVCSDIRHLNLSNQWKSSRKTGRRSQALWSRVVQVNSAMAPLSERHLLSKYSVIRYLSHPRVKGTKALYDRKPGFPY